MDTEFQLGKMKKLLEMSGLLVMVAQQRDYT